MMVIDASIAVEVLLRTELGLRVEAEIFTPGQTLHAPQLLDIEVAHVFRRAWRQGLDAARAERALVNLGVWPIYRYPHDLFVPRIWELRHNITAYDAAYVALAEALETTLLTCDARLAAAPGHRARIAVP